MNNNLLATTIRLGSIEILGIYNNFPDTADYYEDALMNGAYYLDTVEVNTHAYDNYTPLTKHVSEMGLPINDNGNYDMYVVWHNTNCAGNVGITEVKAIINCLVDGAVIK